MGHVSTCSRDIQALGAYMPSGHTCAQGIHALRAYMRSGHTCAQGIHALGAYMPWGNLATYVCGMPWGMFAGLMGKMRQHGIGDARSRIGSSNGASVRLHALEMLGVREEVLQPHTQI